MASREERAWRHRRQNEVLRQVRKEIKRNRKGKAVRRKNWMPDDSEEWDALDYPQHERVVPRGERARRHAIWTKALHQLEHDAAGDGSGAPDVGRQGPVGRVVEVSSGLCRVELDQESVLCALRGSLSAEDTGFTNVVAVGDEVVISLDGADRGVVEGVLPRRTALVRPDVFYSHLQQVVVANADQLLIVSSWQDPAIWLELIDRYLITAARSRLWPLICLNKMDLAKDKGSVHRTLQPYLDLGYDVLFTSATTAEGIDGLRSALTGRMTVLAGLSGVGKSSLLAAVQPGLYVRTAEVSERRHEGRHTTSQVNLWKLESGGYVVDTPGIREFGLSGLRRDELDGCYPEMLAVREDCRFPDCSHTHEPGCAVRQAVRRGQISRARYHSYKQIYDTLPS